MWLFSVEVFIVYVCEVVIIVGCMLFVEEFEEILELNVSEVMVML